MDESKHHTAYSCYHAIALGPEEYKLIHRVFLLPFIFPRAKPSSQTHCAYLSDDLSCRAVSQVLDCDLTCNCGFYIPQVSLCRSYRGGSCLHSSALLESDRERVSWGDLPTITSNPWLTSLFLSLQVSWESPFLRSSVKSWWSHFGKKGLMMYKLGDGFSGSWNGIFTSFKRNLWLCFQFLLGLPLFKGSLEYGFDIT